ncbi:hypothetical protein [Brachybacterium sp. J153]|uniref:hypothetical protein n=1 Tax=Brachybacterium sp. J153 TaxID=3116488 RepID=UPI002E769B9C|nr:hypothetical protein [Brachybacterium sp. J153]MEE1618589.1 hypothetical protein [Brachybacterium sp. J153]
MVTATTLATEGVITLVLADADGSDPLLAAIRAPWEFTLPRGAGLAARADGRIDVREASGPVHATAEAMGAWAESVPTAVERADVIEHVVTVWHALAEIGRRPGPGQIAWFRIPESAGAGDPDSSGDAGSAGVSAGF